MTEQTNTQPRGASPFLSRTHDTQIEIYTDGSCIGNPGFGGYGIVTLRLSPDGNIQKRAEASGFAKELTTNIRMEMTAACVALERLGAKTDEPITVLCDADLIPKAMNDWLANWKVNGWQTSGKKPVANRDLWERLETTAEGRNVAFKWIRGHNGSEHNERADRLAYRASRKAEELLA